MTLNQTANCFQGIDLDYSYMCPQCILEIKGTLTIFPAAIAKDSVHLENVSSSEHNICFQGHRLHPVWITQGYGDSTSDLIKCFQGKNCFFQPCLKKRCSSCIKRLQLHG